MALVDYPTAKLGNVHDLKLNEAKDITYPDCGQPGRAFEARQSGRRRRRTEGDIVAFSTLCPHKGFPLTYGAGDKTLSCPGHYSRFDVEKGGLQIFGHATQNLPQFRLVVDQQATSSPSPSISSSTAVSPTSSPHEGIHGL